MSKGYRMEGRKRKPEGGYFRQKVPWIQGSRLANVHTTSRLAKIRIFPGSLTVVCSGEAWACLLTIGWSLYIEQVSFQSKDSVHLVMDSLVWLVSHTWKTHCLSQLCPSHSLSPRCPLVVGYMRALTVPTEDWGGGGAPIHPGPLVPLLLSLRRGAPGVAFHILIAAKGIERL